MKRLCIAIFGIPLHHNLQYYTRSLVKYVNGWNGKPNDQKSKFVPLRLMVRGAAGTRKSFIINTIVSYMIRIFDDNDLVHVVAPTGMAAFNVLGGTLHRFVGLDWWNMNKGMTNSTMEKLQKKLQNTVAIMMDERSMLSKIILALVEQTVARSAHDCRHSGEDWGGIPVMILFGDDYQLPSIGNGGATNIPQLNKNIGTKGLHDMTQCQGWLQLMNLAEEVMELDHVHRQTDDQVIFKGILEHLRLGWMNEQDEERLLVLTLDYDHYTSKEIKDISEGALHLFARHQAKNAYNEQKLRETNTETNPLVVIWCIGETTATNAKSKSTHLNKTFDMRKTMLCRDAMVEITKVNIEPKGRLFNGAISKVVDIIFRQGENPNE
jgi:hypothetical protein